MDKDPTTHAATPGIRLAARDDAGRIATFNRVMARETEGRALAPEIIESGVERVFDEPGHGFYVVAESRGDVVGCLLVTDEWSVWRNGKFWWIQSVYVVEHLRRSGVYKRMYDFVRERARGADHVCGFRLYVEKDNRDAQAVYQRLGMRETDYHMYEEEL